MTGYDKLDELLKRENGIIRVRTAREHGIHHSYIQNYENMGKIERVSRGIYIAADTMEDKMYILNLQRNKIVYSHETALFLHGLTDRDPLSYDVTVPTGYNTKNLINEGITVYSIQSDLYSLGKIEVKTLFGNKVRCYDLERTICDILRSRNKADKYVMLDAIKRYSRLKEKNLNRLMNYAEKFNIKRIVKTYMEVLL